MATRKNSTDDPARPRHARRGPGGPAPRPCRAAGGGGGPGRRRRHGRARPHLRPAAARHARRADQPFALRRAQGRGRAERAGPVRGHGQGRQGVSRRARRGDHARAAARRRGEGQGAAGRGAQGGGARGRLPQDDQARGAAGLRTVRVPCARAVRDARGVPGAGRLHRQRSAGAGECGLAADRGCRGHDRRGGRRRATTPAGPRPPASPSPTARWRAGRRRRWRRCAGRCRPGSRRS